MNKVACVIVTFNRVSMLKECLEAVRQQSVKCFDVFVVNNGSSDGTCEWLSQQKDLFVINQENLGGAGGFYTGMKKAYDDGYEWVWMMDDDGIADENQLENLLAGAKKCHSQFVNSLVIDKENGNRLSFGLIYNGKGITEVECAKKYNFILNTINPFNGTLIHRSVIEKIGLIKKEMFIWGDEMEYTYRAIQAGFNLYTITSAIHLHPTSRQNYGNIIPFVKQRFKVLLADTEIKSKIMYRNNGYIFRTYNTRFQALRFQLKYFLYYILRFDFNGVRLFYKYFNKGMCNDYTESIM